jgi:hypothetical protein
LLAISGISQIISVGGDDVGAGGLYGVGGTWSPTLDRFASGMLTGVMVESFCAYAVGSNGAIYFTTEPGIQGAWEAAPSGGTIGLFGVWGESPGNTFAVGAGGTILRATSATVGSALGMWTQLASPFGANLRSVWGSSNDDVYIVGEGGAHSLVLHSTNQGASWGLTNLTGIGSTTASFGVGGRSATDVYAVGHGDIFHSGGNDSWVAQKNPSNKELYAVWVAPNGDAFAVGESGTIVQTSAATTSSDMGTAPTCSMSCGANQICVWDNCNSTPSGMCVDVTPSCKAAPSCSCVTCPVGVGSCSTMVQGQLTCGPPGTCG